MKNINLTLSLVIFFCVNLFAAPITESEVKNAVKGWLEFSNTPLSAQLNKSIKNISSYSNSNAQLLYYVVNFENEGFVVVSPNNLIEPIIAFSGTGFLDPDPQNPLFDFLNSDMTERIAATKIQKSKLSTTFIEAFENNKSKWENFINNATNNKTIEMAISSVDDPRVDPLVETKWSQSTANGNACYNYYTPRYVGSTLTWSAGNSANYVCGCVATALAQFLKNREHPTTGIGTGSDTISVSYYSTCGGSRTYYSGYISRTFRGGDDSGGAYPWSVMPLVPNSGSTLSGRQNIGRLTYDAGVAVNMGYSNCGSGTDTLRCKNALVDVFNYANAVKGYRSAGELVGYGLYEMMNPNLDAGIPAILGITGSSGGHAIVCDGYGYNLSTLYHHLNMGWAGSSDAWYDLPDIGTGFNKVYKCVYNIFETGTGEIISGRIINELGMPISNVLVSAMGITSYTDSRGIYALVHVTPGVKTVSANKTGLIFTSTNVIVGTSSDYGAVGNVWEADFVSTTISAPINVAASDGIYSNLVRVTWDTVANAIKYKVYRNTVNNSSGSSDISGEIPGTNFDDITVTPGQLYYYWIKAGNSSGWSDFSSSDSGYALGAELTVTPTFIDFSSNIISKFIYLGNNGTLPYNFTASVSAGSAWLSVLPDNGTVSNDIIALSAKANRSSLSDGTYEGYITISPSVGDQFVVTARVVIAGNTVAAEANGPYYVDQGSPVTFSAAGSLGKGLLYRWEVGIDFITPYNSDFYSYTYTNTFIPATYDVLLTVRDTNSPPHLAADVTTLIINNVPPIVNVGGPYTGSTTVAVFFTAQITDPGILDSHEYRWDFENDGVWDTGWQSSNTASHTYNIGENYLMQCEAKDNYGGVGSDSATVIIDQPNVPPIADAVIYSTSQVETNLPGLGYVVKLDGSGSYDPDSKSLPLYYDWREDVNNPVKNVITEINKHEEIPTTLPLTKPGVYKFHLVVFDGEYNSEPSTITVRVPGWEGEVICEGFIAKIPLWGVNIIVTNTYTHQLDDSGRTDMEGNFLADSGSGYQVAYLDRRNYKQSKSINVGLAGTFTENIYFLPNYYIYAGQIVTGSPGNYVGIIGAKVEALIGNGLSSLTDLMGSFGFGSLPESWPLDGEPYKVRLQRKGFKSEVIDLLLTMNRNSEMILMTPSSGTIQLSGTVYSAYSYLPVEDVVVDFGNGWCTTSGVDGAYGPITIPEGEYAVKMSKEGFDNTYKYTSELNADIELNLAIESGEISVYGVVYDGNGMVITDAVIEVVSPVAGLKLTSSSSNTKATGAGYFDVTVAKGDRKIIVSAPGYESVELSMDVNDNTKQNVVLIPEPGLFIIYCLTFLIYLRK